MTELAWVFLLFALFIFLYYLTFGWLLPFLFSTDVKFIDSEQKKWYNIYVSIISYFFASVE